MWKLVKEIRSKAGELHFRRWRLFETPVLRVYIHHILKHDEDLHTHSHPWNFISLVLKGGYWETLFGSGRTHRVAGSIVHRTVDDFHQVDQIDLVSGEPTGCWTLVVAYGRKQHWGYKMGCLVVPHDEYRVAKNAGKLDTLVSAIVSEVFPKPK